MLRIALTALCLGLLAWNANLRSENRLMATMLKGDGALLRSFANTDTLVLSMRERQVLLDGCDKIDWVTRKKMEER